MAETVPGDFGFLAAARRRDPLLSERLHASISRWLDVLDEQLDSADHPDEPPLERTTTRIRALLLTPSGTEITLKYGDSLAIAAIMGIVIGLASAGDKKLEVVGSTSIAYYPMMQMAYLREIAIRLAPDG